MWGVVTPKLPGATDPGGARRVHGIESSYPPLCVVTLSDCRQTSWDDGCDGWLGSGSGAFRLSLAHGQIGLITLDSHW